MSGWDEWLRVICWSMAIIIQHASCNHSTHLAQPYHGLILLLINPTSFIHGGKVVGISYALLPSNHCLTPAYHYTLHSALSSVIGGGWWSLDSYTHYLSNRQSNKGAYLKKSSILLKSMFENLKCNMDILQACFLLSSITWVYLGGGVCADNALLSDGEY